MNADFINLMCMENTGFCAPLMVVAAVVVVVVSGGGGGGSGREWWWWWWWWMVTEMMEHNEVKERRRRAAGVNIERWYGVLLSGTWTGASIIRPSRHPPHLEHHRKLELVVVDGGGEVRLSLSVLL